MVIYKGFIRVSYIICLRNILNKTGDMGNPCRTPTEVLNGSPVLFSSKTIFILTIIILYNNIYIYIYIYIYITFTYPIAFGCRRCAVDFVTIFFHPSLFTQLSSLYLYQDQSISRYCLAIAFLAYLIFLYLQ